jgi:integrase
LTISGQGSGNLDTLPPLPLITGRIGLRRRDALGLKWSNVDLDRARLTDRRSLRRLDGKFTRHQTKTNTSERTMPVAGSKS